MINPEILEQLDLIEMNTIKIQEAYNSSWGSEMKIEELDIIKLAVKTIKSFLT